jgi:ribosomal-protein-alanine N-acetyltransferase
MPTAVALAVDHCFLVLRLHRVEVNIRPENTASLRVVEKLGFRDEGLRRRYLHIDGAWRDHRSFALTAEEVPGGLLSRWRSRQQQP